MSIKNPVQITGSSSLLSRSFTATAIEQSIALGFTSRSVLVANDGSDSIWVGFNGDPAHSPVVAFTDAAFTFAGTWNSYTNGTTGWTGNRSGATGSTGIYDPAAACSALNVELMGGQSVGVAKIEFSVDGGATWQLPSAIGGVQRSDGATGTAMDTIDAYRNIASVEALDVYYVLPSSGLWTVRVTATGTKNAAASGTDIIVMGANVQSLTSFEVKPTEAPTFDFAATSIAIYSPTTAAGRMVAT